MSLANKVKAIDDLLPQTQCGLCGYGGCAPYAEAIALGEAPINLCPPGGVATLQALAELCAIDATPYVEKMTATAKPKMLAVIREDECIGCTKCIAACPVDAILGSAKAMHTVIASECTGCELCIPPCPVDCIDLATPIPPQTTKITQSVAFHARARYQARLKRLGEKKITSADKTSETETSFDRNQQQKQSYIEAALLRNKRKKELATLKK